MTYFPQVHLSSIFLVGPTAAGKSELALHLVPRVNGEIISVDSMQVYRGMDIGTAKPSPDERQRIPHHLIDIIDLNETFDVSKFVGMAQKIALEILGRGRTPIFCGGTGLYLKAYLEGLDENPPGDPLLRSELEKQPLEALLERLRALDSEAYDQVDRRNPRRVRRALEIVLQTGKPLARARWKKKAALTRSLKLLAEANPADPLLVGLFQSPEELRRRIHQRVDAMFEKGLVKETEDLIKRGLRDNLNASQALGYRQVMDFLQGQQSLEETVELVKTRTRQYAKRQMTWFRTQLPTCWIEATPSQSAEQQAAHIALLHKERLKLGVSENKPSVEIF